MFVNDSANFRQINDQNQNELKLSLKESFPHLFHDTVRAKERVQDHKMTRNCREIKNCIVRCAPGSVYYLTNVLYSRENSASKWG
jgi:hypothetical protein